MHPTLPSYTFFLTTIDIIIVTQTECTVFNFTCDFTRFLLQIYLFFDSFFGGDKIIELKD